MNMLITGGAGFIGSNYARRRAGAGDRVVVLDLLTYAGNEENLADVRGGIRFVRGDISDLDLAMSILRDEAIEVVVNFAAESHNSLAVQDPTRFYRTNVIGTQTLLEAARLTGLARFHHISTCEVYGEMALDDPGSFSEDAPYLPRTPYNASKAAADLAVRAYHETYGLATTISNCCNNYGPYQFPEKIIPLFVTNALDDAPLPMYASTANRREWIHVEDHCAGIDAVLERGTIGETYNLGTGTEASIEEIADRVLALTDKPSSLKTIVPDRPGHDRRYLLDSTKARTKLGWEPTIGFAEGLAATVAWYRENRPWWEPLKARAPVDESGWS